MPRFSNQALSAILEKQAVLIWIGKNSDLNQKTPTLKGSVKIGHLVDKISENGGKCPLDLHEGL